MAETKIYHTNSGRVSVPGREGCCFYSVDGTSKVSIASSNELALTAGWPGPMLLFDHQVFANRGRCIRPIRDLAEFLVAPSRSA
jgi:hypothetical protein